MALNFSVPILCVFLMLSNLVSLSDSHSKSIVKDWVSERKVETILQQNGGHSGPPFNAQLPTVDVKKSGIVVVRQDGKGNFTTIHDAVAAAPSNTTASDGYFVIYITEGVYQEYVVIDVTKTYVMLIGDGINRTVITGDHNEVDGFTITNSGTVGKKKHYSVISCGCPYGMEINLSSMHMIIL